MANGNENESCTGELGRFLLRATITGIFCVITWLGTRGIYNHDAETRVEQTQKECQQNVDQISESQKSVLECAKKLEVCDNAKSHLSEERKSLMQGILNLNKKVQSEIKIEDVQQTLWVNVKDKLPPIEPLKEVLVARRSPYNSQLFRDVALWDGKKWHPHSYIIRDDVSAPVEYWQSLPELPDAAGQLSLSDGVVSDAVGAKESK